MRIESPPRLKQGQQFVELLAGLIVIIPLVLFLFDIGVILLANIVNGDLAKNAARAAANATDGNSALQAADKVVGKYSTSGSITAAKVTYLEWRSPTSAGGGAQRGTPPEGATPPQAGQVQAATEVTVKLPVPLPMLPPEQTFSAHATQPVVALPPNLPGATGL